MTFPRDALLSCAQMGEADRLTIEAGTPGFTLMRRAGQGAATAIRRRYRPAPVLVACGPGNNGGDGFVVADDLRRHGWPVRVALLGGRAALKGDAAEAAALWGGKVEPLTLEALDDVSLLVDALFGAGLARPIDGAAAAFLNEAAVRIAGRRLRSIAIDMPSGVHGDHGRVMGTACPADLTVTFFRRKPGHLLMSGRTLCGDVRVIDIGIDEDRAQRITPIARVNTPALWRAALPVPGPADHKYSRGHVLVIAGRMTGAARLAAQAARRIGAGLVTVLCPPGQEAIIAADAPGLIVQPWPEPDELAAFAHHRKARTLVVGPGLGTDDDARAMAEAALKAGVPSVLDADVFTLFSGRADDVAGWLGAPAVLTPHEGEMWRFLPDLDLAAQGRLEVVRRAVDRVRAVVLLKGPDTTIKAPGGPFVICEGAPASLATGGSGDVLAGAIGGLMAQGMPADRAAAAGAWMHAEAARRCGQGLVAEDLIGALATVRWNA
ncbi:MAG: NAD(P)H-hydrate dehydratase [Alphaproteobacteria bacterium]|nr:NAD(P)H-hydrate dehydratase [Alphaproteobacteria bacterium]